jgi:2-polyprenyl-3-methyl-5-hydroxy-6-metoxy-1,4-benzoquinol methylase
MTEHDGKLLYEKDGCKIIKCQKCEFTHITPLPSEEELLKMYQEQFWDEIKPEAISKYEQEIEYWNMVYDEKLDIIDEFVPNTKRILDVGCGAGFFLMRAKTKGFDVLGIEPSKKASDYAEEHGISVIRNFFERFDISGQKPFDVIHMNAVLEHSIFPDKVIEKCHSLLTDNGIMIIEVPNDFNLLQKIVEKSIGKDKWWVVPKEHINYFNFETLSNLVKKNGFKILLKDSTFPLELFLLMGYDYIGDDKIGREIHNERMKLEFNLLKGGGKDLKRKLYSKFAELGIGRRAIIYAQKSPE